MIIKLSCEELINLLVCELFQIVLKLIITHLHYNPNMVFIFLLSMFIQLYAQGNPNPSE